MGRRWLGGCRSPAELRVRLPGQLAREFYQGYYACTRRASVSSLACHLSDPALDFSNGQQTQHCRPDPSPAGKSRIARWHPPRGARPASRGSRSFGPRSPDGRRGGRRLHPAQLTLSCLGGPAETFTAPFTAERLDKALRPSGGALDPAREPGRTTRRPAAPAETVSSQAAYSAGARPCDIAQFF
jgi:hypothetical protein